MYYSPKTIAVSNPAAGADWSVAVPVGKTWVLKSALWTFTTSATVAQRSAEVAIKDPSNQLVYLGTSGNTVGNLMTVTVVAAHRAPNFPSPSLIPVIELITPPDLVLPAGWIIASSTRFIQSGDQHSGIRLMVEER